jgi:hypothetical protein
MSKSELNYASRRCCLRYAGTILVQIGLIHNSSVSIKRKVSRFMFTSSAIISTVNRRSDMKKFFYPCCVLIFLCCRLWSSELLIFTNGSAFSENILCLRKSCVLDIVLFPKAYCIFFFSCADNVTDFNIKIYGLPLRDVPCFHFHDEFLRSLLTRHEPTLHCGIVKQCQCNWGWRMNQGQTPSVLAGCSIASTARRKLISSLYCQISHI